MANKRVTNRKATKASARGRKQPKLAPRKRTVAPRPKRAKKSAKPAAGYKAKATGANANATKRTASKQARLIALLEAPKGATVAAIASAAGWQPHSVRAFLTSHVRQALGLTLISEKIAGERCYRIVPGGSKSRPDENGRPASASMSKRGSRKK